MLLDSLQDYEIIALKIISNWRKRKGRLKLSDELIGSVINRLITADMEYDASKSDLSREQFRQMRAIYMIRYLCKPRRGLTFTDVSEDFSARNIQHKGYESKPLNEYSDVVQFLKSNTNLTSNQHKYINLFLTGLTPKEIAARENKNIRHVYNSLEQGVRKMRTTAGVSH